MKKIKIYNEILYVIAQISLALANAMMAAADFGVSMIVAPAYIMNQKFPIFTFGQWNYILQGVLFIAFCCAIKQFKPIYIISFITCIIYGTILDGWRVIIPLLNPNITPPGSMELGVRIILFSLGQLLAAFAVMLFFRAYIYPQVCDLFVKGVSQKYGFKQTRLKIIYDLCCLVISILLSLLLLKKFVAIGWGTVVIAFVNGTLIGSFARLYDKYVQTVTLFPKFEKMFKL